MPERPGAPEALKLETPRQRVASRASGRLASVGLLIVVWGVGLASSSNAATFRRLGTTNTLDQAQILGMNPSGDQLVGVARFSAAGTTSKAGFVYGERTLVLGQTGPPPGSLEESRPSIRRRL